MIRHRAPAQCDSRLLGTVNVLTAAAKEKSIKHVVVTSSLCVTLARPSAASSDSFHSAAVGDFSTPPTKQSDRVRRAFLTLARLRASVTDGLVSTARRSTPRPTGTLSRTSTAPRTRTPGRGRSPLPSLHRAHASQTLIAFGRLQVRRLQEAGGEGRVRPPEELGRDVVPLCAFSSPDSPQLRRSLTLIPPSQTILPPSEQPSSLLCRCSLL